VAWKLWTAPATYAVALRKLQKRRCAVSGKRLLRTSEVDHRVPLHRVWCEHRDTPWPALLGFWGVPNLQVINWDVHVSKSVREAQLRARRSEAETLAHT
jgi:hypothetical protein